jgi:hypothetical protein
MDAEIRPSGTDGRATSSPAYEYSAKDSGLMIIRWNRGASEEESRELMGRIAEFWAEGRPYATVLVTHPDVHADVTHRRLWAEWHEANRENINRYCRGTAITLDSSAVRALMTVMAWFSKDAYPIKYVKTEQEARAWAASRLLSM